MKIILFSLLLCVAEIYGNSTQLTMDEIYAKLTESPTRFSEKEPLKIECSANYGINFTEIMAKKISQEEAVELITPYKMGCIVACFMKNDILKGKSTTVVEFIRMAVPPPPNLPYLSEEKRTKYMKIANDCIAEAKDDDCELMKCLKAWQGPFNRFLLLP